VYDGARQEYTAASSQATKGFAQLLNRTRAISLTKAASGNKESGGSSSSAGGSSRSEVSASSGASAKDDASHQQEKAVSERVNAKQEGDEENAPDSSSADAGTARTATRQQVGKKGETEGGAAAAAAAAAERRGSDEEEGEEEGVLSRFRAEALKRLKELEKAEDAADEALLKFGTNVRNFLRDAVRIAPPQSQSQSQAQAQQAEAHDNDDSDNAGTRGRSGARGGGGGGGGDGRDQKAGQGVLYESKDQDGKRVIHTTRFDAQLHVIHKRLESFTEDPAGPEQAEEEEDGKKGDREEEDGQAGAAEGGEDEGGESGGGGGYTKWKAAFDVGAHTYRISADLEKYRDLRAAMEALVPDRVPYDVFWTRYYFLRHVLEEQEERRKRMLKSMFVRYWFIFIIFIIVLSFPTSLRRGSSTFRSPFLFPRPPAPRLQFTESCTRCIWPLKKGEKKRKRCAGTQRVFLWTLS
jgi:hypothetical protein